MPLKKPKFIKIGNDEYIGYLDETQLIVTEAMEWNNGCIRHWFESRNIGELLEIKLAKDCAYSFRELSQREKTEFEYCEKIMERAQTYALRYYENNLFDNLYKRK